MLFTYCNKSSYTDVVITDYINVDTLISEKGPLTMAIIVSCDSCYNIYFVPRQ